MASDAGEPALKDAPRGILEVRKGQTIIREGDPGSEMFVIEEGEVEILKGPPGSERLVGVLSQGDFFGETSVIDDLPRTATARALTGGRLLVIDHSTFDLMLRQHPEFAIRMLRRLSARMREAELWVDTAVRRGVDAPTISADTEARMRAATARPQAGPSGDKAWKLHVLDCDVVLPLPEVAEVRFGRFDSVTGIRPDIDLTDLDVRRTTSRRHARLFREGARLFLSEEIGTANGTFVNAERVGSGTRVEVRDGDWLQFGDVKMVLRES